MDNRKRTNKLINKVPSQPFVVVLKIMSLLIAPILLFIFVSESIKLFNVERNHRECAVKDWVAQNFLKSSINYRYVCVSIKELLSEYESAINNYAITGNEAQMLVVQKWNENHREVANDLNKELSVLDGLIQEHLPILPKRYKTDLSSLKNAHELMIKHIKSLRIKPVQYVHIEGLFRRMSPDMVAAENIIGPLISRYNIESITHYRELLRKDEIKSQHIQTVLTVLITIFFYLVTLMQLWKRL